MLDPFRLVVTSCILHGLAPQPVNSRQRSPIQPARRPPSGPLHRGSHVADALPPFGAWGAMATYKASILQAYTVLPPSSLYSPLLLT